MPHPIRHISALSTPLIKFRGGDAITIRNALEGTAIFGGTGSGKTSGSARAYALSFLRAGMGGLVLCAKPDEADRWYSLASETGRANDLVYFHEDGHRFNFLDYTLAATDPTTRDLTPVETLGIISNVARSLSKQGGRDGENSFFRDAANQMIANALPLLRVAYGTIRLRTLYDFINSAPTNRQEAYEQGEGAWSRTSFCAQTMHRVHALADEGNKDAARVSAEHIPYWVGEFASLADRTRSSVVTTFTSSIYQFLSGSLGEMFCTETTILPEFAREGVIIVLDLPYSRFGNAGLVAQHIFKLMFQRAMEREEESGYVGATTRPVFIFADECQNFLNEHDTRHLAVCRQARVANVFITQDLPTYFARMPSDHEAQSLIGKFGTNIFHASTDRVTCEAAAERIGKIRHKSVSVSKSTGSSSGTGDSIGVKEGSQSGNSGSNRSKQRSVSTYLDYDFQPSDFGNKLRTGGRENRYKIDAIILRNGGRFRSSRKNRIKAEFSQR